MAVAPPSEASRAGLPGSQGVLQKKNYSNSIRYTHSSTLRTIQEIFGVTPLLRDAAEATSLSDLFSTYP